MIMIEAWAWGDLLKPLKRLLVSVYEVSSEFYCILRCEISHVFSVKLNVKRTL